MIVNEIISDDEYGDGQYRFLPPEYCTRVVFVTVPLSPPVAKAADRSIWNCRRTGASSATTAACVVILATASCHSTTSMPVFSPCGDVEDEEANEASHPLLSCGREDDDGDDERGVVVDTSATRSV